MVRLPTHLYQLPRTTITNPCQTLTTSWPMLAERPGMNPVSIEHLHYVNNSFVVRSFLQSAERFGKVLTGSRTSFAENTELLSLKRNLMPCRK